MVIFDTVKYGSIQVNWGDEVSLVQENIIVVFPELCKLDLPNGQYRSEYGGYDRAFPETNYITVKKNYGDRQEEVQIVFEKAERLESNKTSSWPICKCEYEAPKITVENDEILIEYNYRLEDDYYPHCDGEHDRWVISSYAVLIKCGITSLSKNTVTRVEKS